MVTQMVIGIQFIRFEPMGNIIFSERYLEMQLQIFMIVIEMILLRRLRQLVHRHLLLLAPPSPILPTALQMLISLQIYPGIQ